MKFLVDRDDILKVMNVVQRVVEKRNTIPILGYVLIKAYGSKLEFSATDMEISAKSFVTAQIEEEGEAAIPALMVYDILRKLGKGAEVLFKMDAAYGGQLDVHSNQAHFSLPTLPASDFPIVEADFSGKSIDLEAPSLHKMLNKTKFAISNEENRHFLNGVCFHTSVENDKNYLKAAATDGHRLALIQAEISEGFELPRIILPRKMVQEMSRLLDGEEGPVHLCFSDNQVAVRFKDFEITSKLIAGQFPQYERFIPTGNPIKVELDKYGFCEAVDRVVLVTEDSTKSIKLSFEENQLLLHSRSPEAGLAEEELTVAFDKNPLSIGFNGRYLLDVTNSLDGEGMVLSIKDEMSPALITDPANDDESYVIMPMRV